MLVLSRKPGETIVCEVPPSTESTRIEVTTVRIGPNTVRTGIDAPRRVNVVRKELLLTKPRAVNGEEID